MKFLLRIVATLFVAIALFLIYAVIHAFASAGGANVPVCIGYVVGAALLGYWINRNASSLWRLEEYLHRLPAWVKRFPVGSPSFLLSVRIIPGFGGTVATATAAAFRVPVWVHVWTMCAIALPICAVLTIFGDRVTVALHGYESRASHYATHYCETHHCLHFHFRRPAPATPGLPPGTPSP